MIYNWIKRINICIWKYKTYFIEKKEGEYRILRYFQDKLPKEIKNNKGQETY